MIAHVTGKNAARLIPLSYHVHRGEDFAESYLPARIRVPYTVHLMRHLEEQLRRRGVGCIWRPDGTWRERNVAVYQNFATTIGRKTCYGMLMEAEVVISVDVPLLTNDEMGSLPSAQS